MSKIKKLRLEIKNKNLAKISQRFTIVVPFPKISFFLYIINFLVIALVIFLSSNLPPEVPLYYGLPVSEEQIVGSGQLVLPSVYSLIILSLNLLIIQVIRDNFLQKSLIITSLAATFFSSVTTIKIILLVGSF